MFWGIALSCQIQILLDGKNMKIALISFYYGSLPCYFDVWVKTARHNSDFDFLFVTDLEYDISPLDNIKIIKIGLEELREMIGEKMGFPVSIEIPYRLCDFRPAFGLIFDVELKGYDYFGYCDIDLAFGDLSRCVTKEVLAQNEKLYHLDHFMIFKNNEKMRTLFMRGGAIWDYKTVFQSRANTAFAFGEYLGMFLIARANGINNYFSNDYADISVKYSKVMSVSNHCNYDRQLFYWEDGKVLRAYIANDEVKQDEFMYIHWSKKNPVSMIENMDLCNSFYIFPDKIVAKSSIGIPSVEEIRNLCVTIGFIGVISEHIVYYMGRIMSIVKMSKEDRVLRINILKNRKVNREYRRELYCKKKNQ